MSICRYPLMGNVSQHSPNLVSLVLVTVPVPVLSLWAREVKIIILRYKLCRPENVQNTLCVSFPTWAAVQMYAVKPACLGVSVSGCLNGTRAVNVVGANKHPVLHGRVHPEVHDGVVEQVWHSRLHRQWICISWIISRRLFHNDNTFKRWLIFQSNNGRVENVCGRNNRWKDNATNGKGCRKTEGQTKWTNRWKKGWTNSWTDIWADGWNDRSQVRLRDSTSVIIFWCSVVEEGHTYQKSSELFLHLPAPSRLW